MKNTAKEVRWPFVAATEDLVVGCWADGGGVLSGDVQAFSTDAAHALGHSVVFYEFTGSREHLIALVHNVPPAMLVEDPRFEITGWPDDLD